MLIDILLRAMHPLPNTWLARVLRRVERALQQTAAADPNLGQRRK